MTDNTIPQAEVLGTAWGRLLEAAAAARDLDSLIAAHDAYLNSMLDGCLLGTTGTTTAYVYERARRHCAHANCRRISVMHGSRARGCV